MRYILIVAMLFVTTAANAWYHPIIPPVVKTPPVISGGGGGGAAGAAGCLWVGAFVTVVSMAIVADEIKRETAGPACATGKMRKSWFGMVEDVPRLWRPKCKRSDPVMARG